MSIINDIPKAYFDRFTPRFRDGFSSFNMRNTTVALASTDFLPCRAISSVVVEAHGVDSDASAAYYYTGTGVVVTRDAVNQYEGIACIKATVDGTGNRQILRIAYDEVRDLSDFAALGIWTRCDTTSSAIQYVIRDSSGNESYWNIVTCSTVDTWEQAFITLASPDATNGTAADLTDIEQVGYKGLDASIVYLFDAVTAFVNAMKVWIDTSYIGSYFYPVYIGGSRIKFDGGFTSTIVAPTTHPRIDLICLRSDASLTVVTGVETTSPSYTDIPEVPTDSYYTYIPLYAIYVPTTATKIVEYHHKDIYPTDGYIYADLRPWCGY